MPVTKNMRKKLDYLIRTTGRAEAEIFAQAMDVGLSELYRKQLAEAYLSGQIGREKTPESDSGSPNIPLPPL